MGFVVTGGAGFIGLHLVSRLLDAGLPIRVIDDGSTGRLRALDASVDIQQLDISSLGEDEWVSLLSPGDIVFHLAARKLNTPGVSDTDLVATNLTSTIAMARAAKVKRVNKIVFASSLYAYGHQRSLTEETVLPVPNTLYGTTKLAGEHALASVLGSEGVGWASARLYFVYGPKQYPGLGYKSVIVKNFERIRDGQRPLIRGTGTQRLDYIFVEDAVDALLRISAAGINGEVYNICSGETVSILELTALMTEVSGCDPQEPDLIEPDWTEGTIRGGCNAKARQALAWTPRTALNLGLQKVWEDLIAHSEK